MKPLEAVGLTRPALLQLLEDVVAKLGEPLSPTDLKEMRSTFLEPVADGALPHHAAMSSGNWTIGFHSFSPTTESPHAFDRFLLRRGKDTTWSAAIRITFDDRSDGWVFKRIQCGLHAKKGMLEDPDRVLSFMQTHASEALGVPAGDLASCIESLPLTSSEFAEGTGPAAVLTLDPSALRQFQSYDDLAQLLVDVSTEAAHQMVENKEAFHVKEPLPLERSPGTPMDLSALSEETGVDESHLQKWLKLIEEQRQVVFYGPPGTGKTFIAKALARYISGDGGTLETVQFHPSYAYEDFMESIRPELEHAPGDPGQSVRYHLSEGVFKRFCRRVTDQPGQHVFLIDEINRANLPRVLGELLYLLEYREERITLPYSGETFEIPPNVLVFGTMNTADRSISLVDYALRRRFAFIPLFPDSDSCKDVLPRFLEKHAPQYRYVAQCLARLNKELNSRHVAIGHSYFMKKDLDEEMLRRIWEFQICPLLEEHFFDQDEELQRFTFEWFTNKSPEAPDEQGQASESAP